MDYKIFVAFLFLLRGSKGNYFLGLRVITVRADFRNIHNTICKRLLLLASQHTNYGWNADRGTGGLRTGEQSKTMDKSVNSQKMRFKRFMYQPAFSTKVQNAGTSVNAQKICFKRFVRVSVLRKRIAELLFVCAYFPLQFFHCINLHYE